MIYPFSIFFWFDDRGCLNLNITRKKIREEEEQKLREEKDKKIRVYGDEKEEEERKIKEEEERKMKEDAKEGVENLQVGLMNSIQDLLREVKPQLGDLSEEEEDIYTDIKRGMRQDQDEETMRKYEEELRKILNK